jgi:hypothetical protein
LRAISKPIPALAPVTKYIGRSRSAAELTIGPFQSALGRWASSDGAWRDPPLEINGLDIAYIQTRWTA